MTPSSDRRNTSTTSTFSGTSRSVATLSTDSNTALKDLNAVRQTLDQAYANKDLAGLTKFHAATLTATLSDGTRLDRAGYEATAQAVRDA